MLNKYITHNGVHSGESQFISTNILLHGRFLQFDLLRAVAFQLNLKYLQVRITKRLRVVV